MGDRYAKVGLFTLLALAGLAWLSMQSGAIQGFQETPRTLHSVFDNAEGLVVGSKVKMAGVDIGQVTKITLTGAHARIGYEVHPDVPVLANSHAQVASTGLIGEKYLDITPHGTETTARLPQAATELPVLGATSFDNLADKLGIIARDVQMVTKNLRNSLGTEESAAQMQQILGGFAQVANDIRGMTSDQQLQSDLRASLANFRRMSENYNTLALTLNDKAPNLLENLDKTAARLANFTEGLGEGESGDIMTRLNTISLNLEDITTKLASGQGTLGKLINDDDTLEKIDSALKSVSGLAGRFERLETEVDVHTYSLLGEDSVGKSNATVRIKASPTRFYEVGGTFDGFVSRSEKMPGTNAYTGLDFGDDVKINAQFGFILPEDNWFYQHAGFADELRLRVGLVEGSGGIGADWVGNGWTVTANLYDFSGDDTPTADNPHLDIKGKFQLFSEHFYGVVGYDNVFNSDYSAPFVGVGLRFKDDDLKYLLGVAL